MKNKTMIAVLSLLMVLAFCVPAMAGDVANLYGHIDVGGSGASYDLSNNVYLTYAPDSVATNAQYYGLCTVHSGGNRMFATTSETSVIWWMTTAKGTTDPDNIDETFTTGNFPTPWESL